MSRRSDGGRGKSASGFGRDLANEYLGTICEFDYQHELVTPKKPRRHIRLETVPFGRLDRWFFRPDNLPCPEY
jgi:hypothetical protein